MLINCEPNLGFELVEYATQLELEHDLVKYRRSTTSSCPTCPTTFGVSDRASEYGARERVGRRVGTNPKTVWGHALEFRISTDATAGNMHEIPDSLTIPSVPTVMGFFGSLEPGVLGNTTMCGIN